MKRRLIGVVAALAMALVGTVLVTSFVKNAEARALSGEELVEVLVVDSVVEPGTHAEDLETMIRVEMVPAKVRASGALQDLDQVEGLVTEIELQPGEQLVSTRFVHADLLTGSSLAVPPGLLEVTISLEPQRAVGGTLLPGDHVAVAMSFEPFGIGAPPGPDPAVAETVIVDGMRLAGDLDTPNSTSLVLEAVLVTNVQLEELPTIEDNEVTVTGRQRTLAPTGNLLITLAVSPEQLERLIFGVEHGMLWLAAQHGEIDTSATDIQTRLRIHAPALNLED
ncbi:MAG: Flp pilus assembly protein CpaB [Acidimicrobiales bacterium]|jgi:pilus assembly protein CpaB